MQATINKEDIKGYECRHATYTKSADKLHDLVTIKEYIHLKDGTRVPNIRTIKDYIRPYWITKKARRTHPDKLEWEKIENLDKYECKQMDLVESVARTTRQSMGGRANMRSLSDNPYTYGCDISSTAIIKEAYARKYPECISPNATVAALDIETDVVYGTGEILMVGLTFRDKIFVSINETFLPNNELTHKLIHAKFDQYLGKYKKERNMKLEIVFGHQGAEISKLAIEKAHEWKPDFISIWNMNFDLKKIDEAFKKYDYDAARIFSDPAVPDEFTLWKYKEGKTQKVTQDGKTTGLHHADRWHIATCPASFYFLDSMCLYKRIRIAEGMVSSYSLDATLNRHLNLGKLDFTEVEHLTGIAWHLEMQKKYKIEYVIYCLFDCIGLELLDEKIGDIGKSFSALVGVSDFHNFNSNPRRIVDDLHFFCLDRGYVIANTSDNIRTEMDKYVIGLRGWINFILSYFTIYCVLITKW